MRTSLTGDYEIPTWDENEMVMTIDCREMLRATTKDLNEAIEMYCNAASITKYPSVGADMMEILHGFAESCQNGRFLFGTEKQNGKHWLEILMHRMDTNMIDQILMSEDGEEYTLYEMDFINAT